MLVREAIVLLGLLTVSPGVAAKTRLHGTTQVCAETMKEDTPGERGVHVYAFDAAKSRKIIASLYTIDTLTWTGESDEGQENNIKAMYALSEEYPRLMVLVNNTPKLGRATSDVNGNFEIIVPQVDSILLFAEEELEDDPFSFASKVVVTKGQTQVRLLLPMCNKRV
jgi:hypothetical protein